MGARKEVELVPDGPIVPPTGDLAPDEGAAIVPPQAAPQTPGLSRDVSLAESAGMGAVKGLTFGTAPAIAKAGGRLSSLLPTSIRQSLIKHTFGLDTPPQALELLDQNPEMYRETYLQGQAEAQRANPKAFLAGELAGGAVAPVPGAGLAKGVTSVAGKAGVRALQGAAMGSLFGAGEALGEGKGGSEILRRSGEGALAGAVVAPTLGAAGDVIGGKLKGASERVFARAKKDITTGEQNAGIRKVRKLEAASGPDDEKLRSLFGRDPDLYKTIATKARNSPGKALAAVDDTMSAKADRLDELYDKMVKSNRQVTPSDIAIEFDKVLGDRLKAGDLPAVNILRSERARFLSEYGNFGALGADTMRGLKSTAGKSAFEGMPIPGNVKRDIWNVYANAIEKQAKGSGVDVGELRNLNRDMSVLIPAKDALQERATAAAAGRQSIGAHLARGAASAALYAHGGLKEAIAGALLPEAARIGQAAIRRADFALANNPSASAKSGEFASGVLQRLRGGMSLEDATKAAGGE